MDNLSSGDWTHGLRLEDHRDVPGLVAAAGGKTWSPHFCNLSQQALRRARSLGLRVLPWTVNETADMERLLDWGVDGLVTDRPERLRALMQQRGMSLPPAFVTPPGGQTAQSILRTPL
jgi:glycerophosphoryl diester phosphodiesterase